MKTLVQIAVVSFIALTGQGLRAQAPADLNRAVDPLIAGVPEVAVTRLRALLDAHSSDAQWPHIAEPLAQALIAANHPADALPLLEDPRLRDSRSAIFWRAQALANLRHWSDALRFYQRASSDPKSAYRSDALFGEAEMLRALHRPDEALTKFSSLFRDPKWAERSQLRAIDLYLDKSDVPNANRLLSKLHPKIAADRRERHFLRGRLELVAHWPEKAAATFESLIKRPKGASHALVVAALFSVADAHLQLKTPETGDDVLEDFIEHHPQDPDLDRIFAKLDELYRAERRPSRAELENWTSDAAQPRRGLAQWYLARLELRAGRRDRAAQLFAALRRTTQPSVILAPAFLELAALKLEEGNFAEALAVAGEAQALHPRPELLDRLNLLSARAEARAKRLDAATNTFEQVARSNSIFANLALFNAALGWLQLGDRARFLADAREFAAKGGDQKSQGELRLDQGLAEAAHGDKQAADSLLNFLRDFPQDDRAAEAWVALAELAFHASPPQMDDARKYLKRAAESKSTPAANERREYLAIWIEDAAGDDSRIIEEAKKFLKDYPSSRSAPEVRMKLAEVYYRRQDFPNAQTEFELLAQDPSGMWTEKALFFAAESAMSSMGAHSLEQAVTLFDRVVHLNGELKWAARNEQAAIERTLGKTADALALYDEILKGDARPAEKREALCGKADIFLELGATDAKNYPQAVELYDQLASDRDGASHWRNQALFKKGVCLEKEADRAGALATFYDVLEKGEPPNATHEMFWFYKAGFSAARLLEDDAKWKPAVAVYEKLAAAGGARSDEAKQRLERIRLEHFLWEE